MNDVQQLLLLAKNRIRSPKNWIKGKTAADSRGDLVNAQDRRAVAWCLSGAIGCEFVQRKTHADVMRASRRYLEQAIGNTSLVVWNDHPDRTHAEVVALFDRAIALASVWQFTPE